jgi:hypothetical protein
VCPKYRQGRAARFVVERAKELPETEPTLQPSENGRQLFEQVQAEGWRKVRLLGSAIKQIRLTVFLFLGIAAFSQSEAPVEQVKTASPPDLKLVLQSLERVEQQNLALSRAYEVTRQYKAFHGDETRPSAEVTAQISFTPPDTGRLRSSNRAGNQGAKR